MARLTLVVACLVAAVVLRCSGVEAGRVLKDGKLDRKLLWSSTISALSADAHGIGRVLLAPGAEPKDPNEPTGVDRDMSADTHFARIAKFSKKAGGDEEAEGDEGGRRHLMQNVGRVLLAPGAEPKDPNEPTGVDRDMSADTHFARIAKFSKKAGGDEEAEGDEGGRRHLMQNVGRVLLAPGAEPKDPNEPTGVDRDMSADTHFARIAKFSKKPGGDDEEAEGDEGDEGGRRHLMQD